MAILAGPKTWRREVVQSGRTPDLTADESANVRAALRFLVVRHGGASKLAVALGVGLASLKKHVAARGRPGAAVAIRVARLAGVAVEDALSGAWPKAGACPMCGRDGVT